MPRREEKAAKCVRSRSGQEGKGPESKAHSFIQIFHKSFYISNSLPDTGNNIAYNTVIIPALITLTV